MRRKTFAVGVALVLGTANMTTSAMAFGRGGGWGGGGHFVHGGFPGRGFAIARGRFVHPFRRNFGSWPYYGYDYVPTDAFGDINTMTYATPETAGFVPGPPPAPACQRSEEMVTVPSEKGGTRQIKIVRCP
jgi:hypothetical protein